MNAEAFVAMTFEPRMQRSEARAPISTPTPLTPLGCDAARTNAS
jgi:hypothetical protein